MRRLVAALAVLSVGMTLTTGALAASQIPNRSDPLERLARHERHLTGARGTSERSSSVATTSSGSIKHRNFKVLGHLRLPGTSVNADVFFYDHGGRVGKYAYVGTWRGPCSGKGVKIVDVNDPANPELVALASTGPGESTEDMVVRRIGGRDIMGVGVQVCGEEGGPGGLALFDVTYPSNPKSLSFFETPAGGVHELDLMVRPDGRALALLSVPFVEFENVYFGAEAGGDFRIVDISDPTRPVELSNWGVIADSSLPIVAGNDEVSSPYQGIGYYAAYYDHSARAADHGRTAYVSYWDGGVLKFDISDPSNPVLLARTTFPFNADGDAHSLTPYDYRGHRYILQNDEDSEPLSPPVVTSTATGRKRFTGIEEPWMPTLLSDVGRVIGKVHDAGDGCDATDYEGADGKVALADAVDPFYVDIIEDWMVPCDIGRQVLLASKAGAKAFVSNLISPDDAWPFGTDQDLSAATGMPAVQISNIDELAKKIRRSLRSGHSVRISLSPRRPSYGFMRVYREGRGSDRDDDGVIEYREVGRFSKLPHVTGTLEAPPGQWTIHNTEVNGNRAYSSWYSHGIVALNLENPRRPTKVGQFVPPASSRYSDIFGEAFPFVWGVAIDYESDVIYASDGRSGLWIVKPTGAARPSGG